MNINLVVMFWVAVEYWCLYATDPRQFRGQLLSSILLA